MRRAILAVLACLVSFCAQAQVETFPTYVGSLTSAAPFSGTEQIYVLQSGQSRRAPLSALFNSPTPIPFAAGIQIGTLPFSTIDSYTAGSTNSPFLSVRGTFGTPITDQQASVVIQTVRNNTSLAGTTPTLYVSTAKVGSGINIINQAAQFEAVETAGNGGVAGAYSTGACTTASLGNCEGLVGIATSNVAFSTLVGLESSLQNTSGTNATTTFSAAHFAAGHMATCNQTNTCDAGYLLNPGTNTSKFVTGFMVPSGSTLTDSAFRNDASIVNGVDLSRGTYSGSAFKSTGFTVGNTGVVTSGSAGGVNGQLTLNGSTSGNTTVQGGSAGGNVAIARGASEFLLNVVAPGGTAVNFLELDASVTGSGPIVRSAGTDSNINLGLLPKGTGVVAVGANGSVQGAIQLLGATSGSGTISADATGGVLRAPTLSTRQILPLSNAATALPQNTTSFLNVVASGTEANVQFLCPLGGVFKNLFVLSSAPASGQTITNTWRVNGADTALTCTITGTGTTCNDTTHTATCTVGQTYDLKAVTSATTGSIANFAGGVEFDNP